MSIIGGLKTWLAGYQANLYTDRVAAVGEYAVVPQPGARVLETYVNGGSLREYPFAYESARMTIDETTRLANSEFGESFATWVEQQSAAGSLPTLGAGQTAVAVEVTGWAHLYEQGPSDTGIYLIMCRLEYEQAPPTAPA